MQTPDKIIMHLTDYCLWTNIVNRIFENLKFQNKF